MADVKFDERDIEKMNFYKTYYNTKSKTYRVCKLGSYHSQYETLYKESTYEDAVAKAISVSEEWGYTAYVLNDRGYVIFDVTR